MVIEAAITHGSDNRDLEEVNDVEIMQDVICEDERVYNQRICVTGRLEISKGDLCISRSECSCLTDAYVWAYLFAIWERIQH